MGFDLRQFRKPIKHKFFAKKCEIDQKKFPSKLEANYYSQLKLRQKSGEVIFFLRQVRFDLPGGVAHFIDFAVFLADGSVEFVETKGRDTAIGIAKRKIVEDLYPIEIKLVYKV